MKFITTGLDGAYVIEPEPRTDARGFLARTFCAREFHERGLATDFVQCSVVVTHQAGLIRGMHYQRAPFGEVKLVRCTAGALHDVMVDLRPESPTYLQSFGIDLTAGNRRALYVPAGFAHGMQTLAPDTEVFYQISGYHTPGAATGVRHDDPRIAIRWPRPIAGIAERDANWPLLP